MRFSNGVGSSQNDAKPDVRGLAVKVFGVDAASWGTKSNSTSSEISEILA